MRRACVLGAAILIVAATLAAVPAVEADEPLKAAPSKPEPSQEEPRQRPRAGLLQQQLGLSDQQAQAIREINQRAAEARRQHGKVTQKAEAELRLLVLTAADEATIEAKRAEVERLLVEGLQRRIKTLQEISPLLTTEQREKFAEIGDTVGRPRGQRPDRAERPTPKAEQPTPK
jgi:Spy/CpxP family protein refolding chaperone